MQGIDWEIYRTLGEVEIYGVDTSKVAESAACCTPAQNVANIAPSRTTCC